MIGSDLLRRARLQFLMARQIVNWREAWSAYSTGAPMPPLRFRHGGVLLNEPRDAAGFLFFEIFANGCYRRQLPATLKGVAVDIGANIGAFALDMAWRYPSLIIHAYEPDPVTYDQLRRNIDANGLAGRVHAWNEAVGGQAGALRLWRNDGSIAASAFRADTTNEASVDVRAVTLGTVVERAGPRVTLLKMDCEGLEVEILESDRAALQRIERVVLEYHPALVPDAVSRIRHALEPEFDVTVDGSGRCGDLIRARHQRPEVVDPDEAVL